MNGRVNGTFWLSADKRDGVVMVSFNNFPVLPVGSELLLSLEFEVTVKVEKYAFYENELVIWTKISQSDYDILRKKLGKYIEGHDEDSGVAIDFAEYM